MTHTPWVHDLLRMDDRFPHVWCAGCGIGIVMGSIIRVMKKLNLLPENTCLVSGIGCTSRMPGYLNTDTMHVLHGRALPAATGIKLANPDMNVLVVGGDGDMLAIGGNHLIHAAHRNLDMLVIIINNFNYGMTGGQMSPTTPEEMKASTAPYGNIEEPINAVNLALGAGASFVARTTVVNTGQMDNFIQKGMQKKGFAIIDVIANCPTLFGRWNKMVEPVDMMKWIQKNTIPLSKAEKMNEEEIENKFVTGIFRDVEKEEYLEKHKRICGDKGEGCAKK